MPQRIAIAGATGYIGGRLAPRLLEIGCEVRCLVRAPGKLQGRVWTEDPQVEVRQTALDDEGSVTSSLEGCDAAYYLVHSMTSAGAEYAGRDQTLALTFASAAKKAVSTNTER